VSIIERFINTKYIANAGGDMTLSIELVERREGAQAEYFLIVSERGSKQEYSLGKALKDSTFADNTRLVDLHTERRSIASNLSAGYDGRTPTILQIFSEKPLEDVVVDGERKNIHAGDETRLFRALLEKLGLDGIQRITSIASRKVTEEFRGKLSQQYQKLFQYSDAA
jgi:hypothetical protein